MTYNTVGSAVESGRKSRLHAPAVARAYYSGTVYAKTPHTVPT